MTIQFVETHSHIVAIRTRVSWVPFPSTATEKGEWVWSFKGEKLTTVSSIVLMINFNNRGWLINIIIKIISMKVSTVEPLFYNWPSWRCGLSHMPKESPELAGVRTDKLRGVLSIPVYRTAFSSPRLTQRTLRLQNIFQVHKLECVVCMLSGGMQLVTSEPPRAPECYNIFMI
jgi:hypothetical protein